jgi:hypothetical protein
MSDERTLALNLAAQTSPWESSEQIVARAELFLAFLCPPAKEEAKEKKKRVYHRWTPDLIAEFSDAWNSGAHAKDMVQRFGLARGSIYGVAYKLGLPRRLDGEALIKARASMSHTKKSAA